jgi:uncharacterized protein (DUF1330 family)
MAIERLVGLFVTDDELYSKYREGMRPILQTYGGKFGYDFKVSEVLKSEVKEPINRIFTLTFETEESMNGFFSDENYLMVRNQYFDPSVSATTIIAKYER